MFDVNGNTLQAAYSLLRTLESIIAPPEKKATAKAAIVTLKREIRAYTNRPASDSCIIKEYGIDGYVELYRFPDSFDDASKDEAESYFNSTRREYCTPSAYDCTGQRFTNWCKLFRRHGHWFAYHSIGFDV